MKRTFFYLPLIALFFWACQPSATDDSGSASQADSANAGTSVEIFEPADSVPAYYTPADVKLFAELRDSIINQSVEGLTLRELVLTTGKTLIGKPYFSGSLETTGDEKLIVNFSGFDCVTFVENSLAMSRLIQSGDTSFHAFLQQLRDIRYRNRVIDLYPSRLHYFSDWIYNNAEKGIVRDVTQEAGGIALDKTINFMTKNRSKYPALAKDTFFTAISQQEQLISARTYFYIPKDTLEWLENNIKSGDILALTTDIAGLDVVHTGIALHTGGRLHLLHASSSGKQVEISERPLSEYMRNKSSQSGVMVARIVE